MNPTDAAFSELVRVMAALRGENGCPWDKEQTHETLRKYLLEEAYEVIDAIDAKDMGALCEELGDVLLQVVFHAQLAAEAGAFTIQDVVRSITAKLIRRHPHVFGDQAAAEAGAAADGLREARTPEDVRANWDQIKRAEQGREPGIFGEVPENLPGPLYARKMQRRAASAGLDIDEVPYDTIEAQLEKLRRAPDEHDARHEAVGDLLFAVVNVARKLKVDPEIALRASADRFRRAVETAERLADADGATWNDLPPERRLGYYAQARLIEEDKTE